MYTGADSTANNIVAGTIHGTDSTIATLANKAAVEISALRLFNSRIATGTLPHSPGIHSPSVRGQ
jgi:hypothetical protein